MARFIRIGDTVLMVDAVAWFKLEDGTLAVGVAGGPLEFKGREAVDGYAALTKALLPKGAQSAAAEEEAKRAAADSAARIREYAKEVHAKNQAKKAGDSPPT